MSDVKFNFIDIHAHILPGLDDGAQSLSNSKELALEASRNGITHIVATPHLNLHHSLSRRYLNQKVKELNLYLKKAGINVTVYAGAEVICDLAMVRKIKKKQLILMPSKKHVLIHTPLTNMPIFVEDLIFQLSLLNIKPIFAHIELNYHIQAQPQWAKKLVERGALLQVTSATLSGHLAGLAQKTAITLLKEELVFAVASDAHSLTFKPPNFLFAFNFIKKLMGEEYALKLMATNPSMVLNSVRHSLPR